MLRAYICFLKKALLCSVRSRSFIVASRPVVIRKRTLQTERKHDSAVGETTSKSTEEPSTTQRPRTPPAGALFRSLKKSVKSSKDQELIAARVKEDLDHYIGQFSYSQNVFDNVIRFLLAHSCIPAAVAVYDRVVAEGFIIEPSVTAQILVVSSFTAKSKQKLPSSLRDIIKTDAFNSDDLLEVLHWMMHLEWPSEILFEAMSIFNETHPTPALFEPEAGLYKRIISSGVRDGNVEQALGALSALPQTAIDKSLIPDAYATFLAEIRRSVYPDRKAVVAAINQMKNQDVEANLSVWNALIAFEVRTNSLHRPFAIYEALKTSSDFLPDDYTFGSLFNALNRFYNPKRRKIRHGELLPSNIPSPRALYREMIEVLVRDPNDPAFQLTTSLLNVVLRSFVYSKDYAGAYVVIRAFYTFNVPINIKTYFIVIRHLMNRITYGIRAVRRMNSDTWADRFLSLPYPIPTPNFLSELPLSNRLATHILSTAKRRTFKLDAPLYITSEPLPELEPKHYLTPTMKALLGRERILLDKSLDGVPLQRLLKKAVLADLESMRQLGGERAATRYLSRTISSVKAKMVPPKLSERLQNMRKRMRTLQSSWT